MISIVVPCYNTEKTLQRSVESLMAAGQSDYQIILVDDGSTDGTPKLCDEFAESDPRIRVIHQDNRGLMGAWKRGVEESDGEYIAFCDADDYIDEGFIDRISRVVIDHTPDMIVFGMVSEYSNRDRVCSYNRLPEGYYDRDAVDRDILPNLFSDGGMQSELILKSRCSKVFNRDVLLEVMPNLNGSISLGEDQLTVFASLQVVRSLYCMGKYCPYHYVRTPDSMIGKSVESIFEKLNMFYEEMYRIAEIYLYQYPDQLLYDRLCVTLLYVKKYICKSIDRYDVTRRKISDIRESDYFTKCVKYCRIGGYGMGMKAFARLYIGRCYALLYILTRTFEKIRGRDV